MSNTLSNAASENFISIIRWAPLGPTDPESRAAFDLDWGLNASLLFGRQKSRVHHQTSSYRYDIKFFDPTQYTSGPRTAHTSQHVDQNRARTVMIPNVGGFAGVSVKFPNAKAALGYRADLFFGAMDNGIDTARKSNVGFYGPFATVSVGVGG